MPPPPPPPYNNVQARTSLQKSPDVRTMGAVDTVVDAERRRPSNQHVLQALRTLDLLGGWDSLHFGSWITQANRALLSLEPRLEKPVTRN